MAEDILGISGQMDISDIQKSFDTLLNNLNQLGVKTDEVSSKMTKALNDIASSSASDSSKTEQAIKVLKDGIAEINKSLTDTPEALKKLAAEAQTAETTVDKLKKRLSEAGEDKEKWTAINSQLSTQQQLVGKLNNEYSSMLGTFSNTQQYVGTLNAAIETLNAGRSISTGTTVASATAHLGAAAAIGMESAAHGENAGKISEETKTTNENIAAKLRLTENVQDYVYTAKMEAEAIDAVAKRLAEGKSDEEEYLNTKKNGLATQESLVAKIEQEKQKITELGEVYASAGSTPEAKTSYEEGLTISSAKIKEYRSELSTLNKSLEDLENAHYRAHQAIKEQTEATQNLKQAEEGTNNTDAIKAKEEEIQRYKDELSKLMNDMPNFWGLGTDIKEGKSPFSTFKEYATEIGEIKIKLSEAEEELEKLKNVASDGSTGKVIDFSNYSADIANISYAIDDTKKRLAEYEAQYDKLANKDNLTEKQKQELVELAQKINDTKQKLEELSSQLKEKNEETFIGNFRNKLSETGQKVSEFGEKIKNGIISPINSLQEKVSGSSFGQRFGAEFTQAKAGLNDFKDGVINVMTANGKFQEQIDVIGKAFKGLGIPISGSLTAIQSVTKALWAMCATPIGATIAAVALAFKAVHTWMTKSAEGQQVYTKLMAYFGSLAKSVTDIVVILGSYLYHCFTDANAPLKNFGNNFVKTFKTAVTAAVNLVSGLGTTIKGVFNLDWDTFASGLKQTWDGIKGAGSTIISGFKTALTGAVGTIKTIYDGFTDDKLGKNLSSTFNSIFSKASEAASLAGQIQQTQIAIKKNTLEQAKLNEKIAEQKNKIYTLQGKEKIAAIETTKELIKQKYDKQIQQQQRLVELSEKNAKLHTQSLESIAAERELRKDVLNTQTQLNADQRMLVRQEESAKKSVNNQDKNAAKNKTKQDAQVTSAEGKLNEVEYKNDYARLQAMQDMEQKIADAKIEALEEGEEKILAQRKRQLEKELEQIEKEKEAAVKAERDRQKAEFDARQDVTKAKGGKVRNWNDKADLDNSKVSEIASQYDEYAKVRIQVSNQNEQKRIKEQKENERASVQSYLKEYGTSEEKRTVLKDEAEDKKKKLDENKTISDTDREYQKKSIDEGLKKSLKDLDFQDLKKSINWDFVFGDLEHVSKSTLGTVKEQLQSFMDSAKDLKPDEIKTLVDAMTQIQDKMDLTTPISSIKSARKEYKELSKEYKKYKQEYDDASASGDVDKQKTAAEKMVKTEQKMVKAQNKEKASYEEVMNVAKQYAQALNDVGETIGGTTGECIKLAASAISCGLSMAEGIKKFSNAVSAMEKAVAILAIIEAALQAIQVVMNAFGGTDTTLTDYVDTMNVYINLLNDSISDLNESMSDTQNTMKDTIAYYEDLVKLEKDSATAIKSQSQTWLNSGASWKSSSQGVKIRKQIEKDLKSSNAEVKQFYTEGYNALNEYYKKVNGTYAKSASDFGRMDFLWKLSDEDLVKLSEDTKALSLLGDTLSSAITEYAEKIKAISDDEDSLGESLLSVSFDDFYDDFTSLIKDMDNDSEDFANNFAEYMRNALVKNLVAEQYKGKLETLYKKATDWAKAGVLEDHIDELKKEYEEYADSAKKDVETIDKITGYEDSSEQSATTKAIEAITEDQASSLIGIGYAMQIALEQGNEVRASIGVDISSMRGYTEQISNNITEMRDIQYEGLGQLQQIVKNTAPIILIREDISSMYKLMKDKY